MSLLFFFFFAILNNTIVTREVENQLLFHRYLVTYFLSSPRILIRFEHCSSILFFCCTLTWCWRAWSGSIKARFGTIPPPPFGPKCVELVCDMSRLWLDMHQSSFPSDTNTDTWMRFENLSSAFCLFHDARSQLSFLSQSHLALASLCSLFVYFWPFVWHGLALIWFWTRSGGLRRCVKCLKL